MRSFRQIKVIYLFPAEKRAVLDEAIEELDTFITHMSIPSPPISPGTGETKSSTATKSSSRNARANGKPAPGSKLSNGKLPRVTSAELQALITPPPPHQVKNGIGAGVRLKSGSHMSESVTEEEEPAPRRPPTPPKRKGLDSSEGSSETLRGSGNLHQPRVYSRSVERHTAAAEQAARQLAADAVHASSNGNVVGMAHKPPIVGGEFGKQRQGVGRFPARKYWNYPTFQPPLPHQATPPPPTTPSTNATLPSPHSATGPALHPATECAKNSSNRNCTNLSAFHFKTTAMANRKSTPCWC